ncbi:MAG: oligosaccharide flippase family protein [Caldicoprobacterales bacterium]
MKTNQLKSGVVLSYVSMILGFIIQIVYTPIMLRLLGQTEYGLYNLVASVVSYLGLLSFGFGSAYIRYYSRYKVNEDQESIAKLNGMFIVVYTIIGIIAMLVGTILVSNIRLILGNKLTASELSTAKILMIILVFNISLSFPASVFNSYVTANERYIFQKALQLIKTVVSPFITLPILLMGYKSIGMVVVTTLLNISIEIANFIFCIKKLRMQFNFGSFDLSLMKEMTIFSSYIFINMIIDQINWSVDKFILGRFSGTIAVAVYGLGAQLNQYYISISTAVSNVFIPKVNRMVAKNISNHELTELFTKVGRVQFIILTLICTGLIFFGQPFIIMWAGNDYSGTYPIALLLIIPVTIPLIQNIGIEIQKAKNMHQFRSWVYLGIAVLNVLLSIPLAKVYGGVGAALGTTISLVIGNGFIMNWYYHYRIGLDIKYFWSQILRFIPSLIMPVLYGILINAYIDIKNPFMFFISGVVYIIIFCISMWFFGMNQYEKNLVGKPVVKLLRKIKPKKIQIANK